jgi:hypothetical protein
VVSSTGRIGETKFVVVAGSVGFGGWGCVPVFVWNESGFMLWVVEVDGVELLETVDEDSLFGEACGVCGVCSVRGYLSGGEEQ